MEPMLPTVPPNPVPHLVRIPESGLSAKFKWTRKVWLTSDPLKEVATRYPAHVCTNGISRPQRFRYWRLGHGEHSTFRVFLLKPGSSETVR
jgi:hypothetical protein